MDRDRFRKKRGNAKQAWLDWLADDPPAPGAKEELRERFKQQANSYQPRSPHPTPPPQPQASVAAPVVASQPLPVSNTSPAAHHASTAPKTAAPATVSIQIHIPSLHSERVQKLIARMKAGVRQLKAWVRIGKAWFLHQLAEDKRRTIGVLVGIAVVVLGLFIPPLFNFGYGKPKVADGTSSGSSAGATVKYDKPPFTVVRPSSKPKLGTPDGVHSAYDGAKNSYSYSDSIAGNGIIVSQQPIPPQFKDGTAAVESIAPTLNKSTTPKALTTLFGTAYVSTNQKYGSQSVVFSIRDLLLFIQTSHTFKDSEWVNYINTLQ